MVLAVLLQNSCVFPAFSDRSTSGQSGARPLINGKSLKKLEKLGKHNYLFDFQKKRWESLENTVIFLIFIKTIWKSWENTPILVFYIKTSWNSYGK